MADHDDGPEVVVITLYATPDGDALHMDLGVGDPLSGWTGDEVAAALGSSLGVVAQAVDARWSYLRAARN